MAKLQGESEIDKHMQNDAWKERIELDSYSDNPFHVSRYVFAARYIKSRSTLDIACGAGFGTRFLKENGAASVVGMDIEASAIDEIGRAASTNLMFAAASATEIPLPTSSMDVIVSMETIEHIVDYRAALQEFHRTMSPAGILILSTPNSKITKPINGVPRNPFHVKEFEPSELREILEEFFSSVEFFGQRIRGRTAAMSNTGEAPENLPLFYKLVRAFPLSWRINLPKLLPPVFANWIVKQVTGHNLDIGMQDIEFSKEAIEDAPVIVALCSK